MPSALPIEEYQPRSELVVPEHPVSRALCPVIDAHNHLTHPGWPTPAAAALIREMDEVNVNAARLLKLP